MHYTRTSRNVLSILLHKLIADTSRRNLSALFDVPSISPKIYSTCIFWSNCQTAMDSVFWQYLLRKQLLAKDFVGHCGLLWDKISGKVSFKFYQFPKSLTGDVGLPRNQMYIISVTTIKTMKRLPLLDKRCCLALGIASHIFELFPTKFSWSDWSTRFFLTNLIGWLFSDVTGEETLLGFSGQPKSDKIIFWVSFIGGLSSQPIFIRFCSNKKQCLSQAVYFHISNIWISPYKLTHLA